MEKQELKDFIQNDIRTFGRRHGKKLSNRKQWLMENLLPKITPDFAETAKNRAILEIGFGNGEHVRDLSVANPDSIIVGAEPFANGVAALLSAICDEKDNICPEYKNIRIWPDDVRLLFDKATFQFDTGALIEGDWTHVILLANYQMIYRDVIGIDNGKLWAWQTTEGYVNGLGYEFIALLGYQMPKLVDLIGIMADMYGFYRNKDYGEYASTYGKFMRVDFNFLARLALNKINSITISTRIASRRSFAIDHKKSEDEPHLLQTGREWHFDRIAFTWERKF